MTEPRLLFAFRQDWAARAAAVAEGLAPAEDHGVHELLARGIDVEVAGGAGHSPFWRAVAYTYQRLYAIPRSGLGYRLDQARQVAERGRADPDRWVVATTDSLALPLLMSKITRATNPVAYISMGLCDRIIRGRVHRRVALRYLRAAGRARCVLVFTPKEAELLREWSPGINVHVIPFGVDPEWWRPPAGAEPGAATVFSAGRDSGRAFPALAEAVARLPVTVRIAGSVAARQGLRPSQRLRLLGEISLVDFRAELWRAAVVAIPTRSSIYGSGQATALEAMAAGKAVVMTDPGWAAHFGLTPGEDFVPVPPEDAVALREAIAELVAHPEEAEAMGEHARSSVVKTLTAARQADGLLRAIEEVDV